MVERQQNWLGQQRVDVPHLRSIESSVAADFDLLGGQMLGGRQALILKGFNVITTGIIGGPATNLLVRIADGMLMHYGASEAGTLFWAPSDRADEQLISTNTKVSGSFTASQTNFIGIDLTRAADDTTADNVQFLEPTADEEISKTVPLARTLDVRFVITTADFASQSTILPIAKVVTDASNNVVSVADARQQMFRLGDGGDNPNRFSSYSWPGSRYENVTGDIFTGGDKNIGDMKTWMDAMMTRLWEVGGGEYWYSATADRNVNMVWMGSQFSNGENFEFVSSNLHWKGLRFMIDNSSGYVNDIQDRLTNLAGLTDLAVGECLYVDLDRTKFRVNTWAITTAYVVGDLVFNDTDKAYECITAGTSAGSGGPTGTGLDITDNTVHWKYVGPGAFLLTAAKGSLTTLGSPTIPGSRQIIAWRVGASIYTRGWRYPIGTVFTPATTTSQGVVKITRDYLGNDTPGVSGSLDPIALSDRGGTITPPGATKVGLIIKAFASGTADIQQWQTSGAFTMLRVSHTGELRFANSQDMVFENGGLLRWDDGVGGLRWKLTGALSGLTINYGSKLPWAFNFGNPGNNDIAMENDDGSGGTINGIVRLHGLTLTMTVGTTSNHPLIFRTNNTDKWQVKNTGELASVGGPRAIQSVLDPVTAQDAATKIYVDKKWDVAGLPNYLINSHMRYWQRNAGASVAVTGSRSYNADRWQLIRDTGASAGMNYDRVAGAPGFKYATRLQRPNAQTDATAGFFWQEVDRDAVYTLQGRRMRLTFRCQKGATYAANLGVQVYSGTNASQVLGLTGYTTGNTTVLDTTITPTTSWVTYTVDVGVISTSAVALAVRFKTLSTGTAGATDSVDITGVHFYEVDNATDSSGGSVSFELYGQSEQAELDACLRYFEKSYELETAPQTNTTAGAWTTNVSVVGATVGNPWPLGFHPRFKVHKWQTPTLVNIFGVDGTIDQWTFGGTNNASSEENVTTIGFDVYAQTSNTPGQRALGHFTAEAEL